MKKVLFITICFVIVTVLGTILHELGHLLPAKMLGYEATLHYGSTSWVSPYLIYADQLYLEYLEIEKVPQEEINKLSLLNAKEEKDRLLITLGGPIQTLLTGITGMFLLYIRRDKWKQIPFGLLNWLGVFLGLFWSRPVFNMLVGGVKYYLGYSASPFGGDEAKISGVLNIYPGTLGLVTGIIGLVICYFIVFKIVPRNDRYIFFTFGILGSALGYITWFKYLGPIILP